MPKVSGTEESQRSAVGGQPSAFEYGRQHETSEQLSVISERSTVNGERHVGRMEYWNNVKEEYSRQKTVDSMKTQIRGRRSEDRIENWNEVTIKFWNSGIME